MTYNATPAGSSTANSREILVVDDTLDNLTLLRQALSTEGYLVRCAKSTTLALNRMQVALPDLVLLDIRMPQMDGYEFCRRLKADRRTQDIPVIFLSVLDSVEDKVRAFGLGGVDFIVKPFEVAEVLARVRHQFQVHQLKRQLQGENDRLRQENVEYQQAYQLLSQVLNSLADGIAAFRAVRNSAGDIEDFRCLLGNGALADWVGRSPADLAGATLAEILVHCPNDDLFDRFIQVVEQHQSLRYELLCGPDGEIPLWFELMATRLGDGLVARLKNITQYKRVVTQMQSVINELQVLTTQDSLTGVANRRAFDQYLAMEWQRLARTREPLSLIMADIDRFKRFNDLCGHAVGDECLRQVAKTIAAVLKRPADLVSRYGGEEFAVLLPQTDAQGAMRVAEAIQAALGQLRLTVPNPACERVSLSLGVNSRVPQPGDTVDRLLGDADSALYSAKRLGGNRIVLADAAAAGLPLAEPGGRPADATQYEAVYEEE